MPTQKIRELIKNAISIEAQTGRLSHTIKEFYAERGKQLESEQLNCLLGFVQQYIELAPAFLDDLIAIANKAGVYNDIRHLIDVAVEYFLSPLDVIPDDLGLLGLMDDAYLTHRLIQALVNAFQLKADKPLLSPELAKANLIIRKLIGEPQATMLDNAVAFNFKPPVIHERLAEMFEFSRQFKVENEYRIEEIIPINEMLCRRHHHNSRDR